MNLKEAGIYGFETILKGVATNTHVDGIKSSTPRVVNIPAYQRPYRWTVDNIAKLFADYDDNNSEYFIGSAVVVEKKKDNMLVFDVVDGQQRITTLFLINYVRFLLKREYVLEKLSGVNQFKTSKYCSELRDCYIDMIGKNDKPFDNIMKKIDQISESEEERDSLIAQLIECYMEELHIPKDQASQEDTMKERTKCAHDFFDNEHLSLTYSRESYDKRLKDALCRVYLRKEPDTNQFKLVVVPADDITDLSANYLEALGKIFTMIWNKATALASAGEGTPTLYEICEKAIIYADEIIRNLSLCIVVTENENDAYKLFEVLNDRALAVDDLELIKNHFYMEYCTQSRDSNEEKDKNITELDALWTDTVFADTGKKQIRLISYLAAVYFTGNEELHNNDNVKLKDEIAKGYHGVHYPANGANRYEYKNLLADFNVYYAISIILKAARLKYLHPDQEALEAEKSGKSITYKALNLLNAMGYAAVMPAIINVILAIYKRNHKMDDAAFGSTFKAFVDVLMNDKANDNTSCLPIHQCAYMLWTAALMAKDYNTPRALAKSIISRYSYGKDSTASIAMSVEDQTKLGEELEAWLSTWKYGSRKDFSVKVIMLNLLFSNREPSSDGYKKRKVTISFKSALDYTLNASDLHLDHLEAREPIAAMREKYYSSSNLEKRSHDVNNYIGNFMILDKEGNTQKTNYPLAQATTFYESIKDAWLVDDIFRMVDDPDYFDQKTKVPYEAFFVERSKQLKAYFGAFLKRPMDCKEFTVTLRDD